MQTETHPQPYGDTDEDSWDLQFDGDAAAPVEDADVPFRPIGSDR